MNRYVPYFYALVAFVVALTAGVYFYERPLDISNFSFVPHCAKPIPYTIGTVDPKFAMTNAQIIAKLDDASRLWNDAAGKPVFAYDPTNNHAIPVNFVYDTRQQAIELGTKIDTTEASQSTARTELNALVTAYRAAENAYAKAVASLNTASLAYSEEVRRVNAAGGADKETYARLHTEQARLNQQQDELKQQGVVLDAQSAALKTKTAAFNASVNSINKVVNQFNAAVGGDFEEGEYVRDAAGNQRIDIYAYKTQNELIHSLAHELGHVLGLAHNDNPKSIMFPYNKSGVTLSDDDVTALKTLCRL
ncbi:MAG: matrixin family metalloprotease [Parcubacteria group bacterium]|nr:matrixin family metalloprotease [Parcubacteria group bacterium]